MKLKMAQAILSNSYKYTPELRQQAQNFLAGQAKGRAMGMAKNVVKQGAKLRQSATNVMLNGGDKSKKGLQAAQALAQRGQQLQQQASTWKQNAKDIGNRIQKVDRGMQFDKTGKLIQQNRQAAISQSMSPLNTTINNIGNSTITNGQSLKLGLQQTGRNLKADALKTKRLWGQNATGWRKNVKNGYNFGKKAVKYGAIGTGAAVAGTGYYLATDK